MHQKDYLFTDNSGSEAISWRLKLYLMKGNVKIDKNIKRSQQLFKVYAFMKYKRLSLYFEGWTRIQKI